MKMLQEMMSLLNEEPITVKPASELWSENKDNIKNYVTQGVYLVKKKKGEKPTKWEVYSDKDASRTLVGTFDTASLEAAYVPVRANQKPDAEGYITYRENQDVEAFKYDGETIKVDLETKSRKLSKGDYLIRETDGDNFVYSVQKEKSFESNYTESK